MSATATLARRAIRSLPAARAIVESPPLRRAIGAQRAARVLRPAARFLAGEARVGTLGRYGIRGTDRTVYLRHGSRDVEIFNEIFRAGRCSYEPPPGVAAALDALGPLRIGDLGGNIGLFGVYALARWPVATLRSFEPDPANAALLRATIAANDASERWQLAQAAVSNEYTTATFESGLLSESRIALDTHRGATPADNVHATATFETGLLCESRLGAEAVGGRAAAGEPGALGGATIDVPVVDLFSQPPTDLLKIDIEGAEWAILGDPRLASHPARAIVLEWHRRMCPAPDPRGSARALLTAAGYEVIDRDAGGLGDPDAGETASTNGLMWALRR